MYDAYTLAMEFVERDWSVSMIPVENDDGDRDVAVIALEPNDVARRALESPSRYVRGHASAAVLVKAHTLLPDQGLRFACHFFT
jgi:hypothetical protein